VPLPRSMLRLTDDELEELLSSELTLRAGTVGPDGWPHVAPLWFVWHDGAIWINSLRRSKRTSDLAAGSKVALCVDTGTDYSQLRGAVLYGTPHEAEGDPELETARKAFAKKNWNIDDIPAMKSELRARLQRWESPDPRQYQRLGAWLETPFEAMAHIMLPSLSLARRGDRPGKTPHTAVPALIEAMVDLGAERKKITGRLVGGASLFASLTPPGSIQMGERNVVSCREVLNREAIPLVAEQVGGETGRSVWLYASDGRAIIRSASQSEQLL